MHIIPVIDLMDGQVVSAQQGKRKTYYPIQSKLCASSSIGDILNGFLSIYPFKTIYIADLNAITHTRNNQDLIDKVILENQHIEFWIDNGIRIENLENFYPANYRPVIGSESQSRKPVTTIMRDTILSLDFFPKRGYKGPKGLTENSAVWPQCIIIMTLDRVGNNKGPDIEKLTSFQKRFPDKNFIAAGGIRNESDLKSLQKIGINHALVASAIHSGELNTKSITKIAGIKEQTKKCPE